MCLDMFKNVDPRVGLDCHQNNIITERKIAMGLCTLLYCLCVAIGHYDYSLILEGFLL